MPDTFPVTRVAVVQAAPLLFHLSPPGEGGNQ